MTLEQISEILQNVLAIIGALKVISRYTPWKWDDAIFNFFDKKDSTK